MTDRLYAALVAYYPGNNPGTASEYRMLRRRGWAEAYHLGAEIFRGGRWQYRLTHEGILALREERERRASGTAPIPLMLLWQLCYAGGTHNRELALETLLLDHDTAGLLTEREREKIRRQIEWERNRRAGR